MTHAVSLLGDGDWTQAALLRAGGRGGDFQWPLGGIFAVRGDLFKTQSTPTAKVSHYICPPAEPAMGLQGQLGLGESDSAVEVARG
jgi:hypothetical protein